MQLHASAVKQFALAHNIPVMQPASLKLDGKYPDRVRQAEEAHAQLRAIEHDVMVVAAYGLILPRSILEIPPKGCLNIHGSILPRWRGAAPIHRAIEMGDTETGITIMQMDEGLDTGDMLAIERIAIEDNDCTASLHDKLAKLGGEMIVHSLFNLANGKLEAVPQPSTGVTYAEKVAKDEALLNFACDAKDLWRKVRAFNPFPGAHALFNDVPIKIWQAEYISADSSFSAGDVIVANAHDGILVACGKGVLRLLQLQKPGGKRLAANEFIKAFPLEGGSFS
jgi:methionyl-tRNA formyltransferase